MRWSIAFALNALLLSVLGGCVSAVTTPAFDYRFRTNDHEGLAAVLAEMGPPPADAPQNASGAPLIVGVTSVEGEATPEIVALSTEGETRWRKPIAAMTRPEIEGDLVITSTRDEILALDLATGNELWRRPTDGLAYVGAAREGATLYLVTSVGTSGGERREALIAAVDPRSGSVRWSHTLQATLGAPVARGGFVLLPWDKQNIAILDGQTGVERARIRTSDDVYAWLFSDASGIFYGSDRGIYRLSADSAEGTREGAHRTTFPVSDAPRDPAIADDNFIAPSAGRSARGRIRYYFAPSPGGEGLSYRGDRVYYVYFRYVFAYEPDGSLAWATPLSEDIIRAQPIDQGLFVVTADGQIRVLAAATGNAIFTQESGLTLGAATLDVAGFQASGDAGAPVPLEESLVAIAGDVDNRLAPARAYAVTKLGALENPEVSQSLLDLYRQPRMPSVVRDAIAASLLQRDSGIEYAVSALGEHYNYLRETKAPPFELVVPVYLAHERRDALAALDTHLWDHETPTADLPRVLRAIVDLGDETVVPSLLRFLRLFRADSTFASDPTPLVIAAEGVFRHGGEEGQAELQALAGAAGTGAYASTAIRSVFEAAAARQAEDERLAAEAEAREAALRAQIERANRPRRLSQAQISGVFREHSEQLQVCVADEKTRDAELSMLRFTFIIEQEGNVTHFGSQPNSDEFRACIAPMLEELRFPGIQDRRQPVTFTIRLGGSEHATSGASAATTFPYWWSRAEAHADAEGFVGRPWWEVRVVTSAEETPGEAPEGAPGEGATEGGEGGEPWWLDESSGQAPADGGGSGEGEVDAWWLE